MNSRAKDWVVLVVDDTPDNLMLIKTVLNFRGAVVHTASSGMECLEMLKTIHPTFILLDIQMPEVDGWEVFKAIRQDLKLIHLPVIAVTAYAMDSDREEILKAGFNGYISKPLDMITLVDDISEFLTVN